jgi:hypothetical protein
MHDRGKHSEKSANYIAIHAFPGCRNGGAIEIIRKTPLIFFYRLAEKSKIFIFKHPIPMGFPPFGSGEVTTIVYNLKVFKHIKVSINPTDPALPQDVKGSFHRPLSDPFMYGIMPLKNRAGLNTKYQQIFDIDSYQ